MNVDFTTIARGSESGYQSASQMVIDNSEEWIDLWQQHTYNTEPPPPVPQVDFTSYSVVAVFAGEKPTSGYSVEILSVETSGSQSQEQLAITVQHRHPSAGDFVTEALTYPYHMIRIPRIDGRVVFKHI
ncbi:protease complex subunit PrcB family protein (plasmid) [Nostoc sp. UHCC 0926]|uniref:protease complex subunit PrcB family protein n=1 Tax=Nostoc sp. UHCC 0926 TaxID=3025190 RepID=UPI002360A097|nr:protease complex subunit PrcB family protein [Nostoc sp. UHCC 0926]WDD36526.1 protease complex subunit PrcB family protein [Nostoc sp. UHCC 0926]